MFFFGTVIDEMLLLFVVYVIVHDIVGNPIILPLKLGQNWVDNSCDTADVVYPVVVVVRVGLGGGVRTLLF